MNKEKIGEWIYWLEINANGLRNINGGNVEVINLKVSGDTIFADIILEQEGLGDEEGYVKERYDDCEYRLSKFKEWQKKSILANL